MWREVKNGVSSVTFQSPATIVGYFQSAIQKSVGKFVDNNAMAGIIADFYIGISFDENGSTAMRPDADFIVILNNNIGGSNRGKRKKGTLIK